MLLEPLFKIKITCLMCSLTYETSRVRPSFKRPINTDTDFCGHYKVINPDFYVVRICPQCGFSSTENFVDKITEKHRSRFNEKIAKNWVFHDFGGERTWNDAIKSYKLSLLCAQIKGEKQRIVAGILHHIAWLYRYKGNKEQELRFLEYSLEAYTEVFENEVSDLNNARLMYLIGELNRRLSRYHDAVKWFGRVIHDKKIIDASMIRACREQWEMTREDMLNQSIELPYEMKEA